MKKTLLSTLCFCFLFSCKIYNNKTQSAVNSTTVEKETMGESIIYTYEDSLSIGEQGKYKLCATGSRLPSENWDMLLLKTNLSKKYVNDWISIQNLTDTVYDNACVDIETEDINNDGMGDFSFQYALAGRGFNILRKHYIFDKNKKQLIAIKNSPEYPNLTYNEDLDCIESNIGHGGNSTVFFKLEADSLRIFASIDMYDNQRIVSVTDKKGEKTIISETSYSLHNEDADMTYGDYNYQLLKEYKD